MENTEENRRAWPLSWHVTGLAAGCVAATAASLLWLPQDWRWLDVALVALLAAGFSRRVARTLATLAEEAEAIRGFDFSDRPVLRSRIREADRLAHGLDLMRDTLRRFLQLNREIAGQDSFDTLLPIVLRDVQVAAGAKGGVLYLADGNEDGGLVPEVWSWFDASQRKPDLPALGPRQLPALMEEACARLESQAGSLSPSTLRALGIDAQQAGIAAAVPLLDRREQWIGCMLLLALPDAEPGRLRFLDALAASAGIALETRELIGEQKRLLDAVIRMIAGAIDAQSPYTGGHCERVPELTRMLAVAACEAETGPYAEFALDEDAWEAVRIASWLHDCGKVSTPEHVVDKATKLETVYDRIHEVRMRFEVLKRDAQVAYWQGLAGGGVESELRRTLEQAHAALDADFAFVASCNVGGEAMTDAARERLHAIAGRSWLRTLDDGLGISRDERSRRPAAGARLPCAEPLLADRPEHRIAWPQEDPGTARQRAAFPLTRPEWLYDRGELHNLGVGRGTLTPEERYVINEHIVHTIMMLEQLPFPRHLRAVPELAGGHHEKMDGSGYPKGLARHELSPVARMMALADIFEALTAADRPYKPAKTLSEALAIMARMVRDAHIDHELFELFLRAEVHQRYAEAFLQPGQLDAVDIDALLRAAGLAEPADA